MEKIKTLITTLIVTFGINFCCLTSCTTENSSSVISSTSEEIVERDYLEEIFFSVSYEGCFEEDKPDACLFDNSEDLTNYCNIFPCSINDDFYTDIENFEEEYGFDNYLVIYFGAILNITYDAHAYIDEAENGNIVIIFEIETPNMDVVPQALKYLQKFYLIDVNSFEDQISTITLKRGENVLYSVEF